MAILETLYILFKGDASQLLKESEKVEASNTKVDESFKKTAAASEKVRGAFFRLAAQFGALVAFQLSTRKIFQGLGDATAYVVDLNRASKALGVNIETLDTWGNAVKRTGGTAEGFQQSLRSLAQHLGTSSQTALQILPQLADAFQRMGRVQALRYGNMLGLDEATILLLQKGRREVDALLLRQKELGVITAKDSEVFVKFDNQLQDTGHSFRSMFVAVATTVLPTLEKLFVVFGNVAQFFKEHSDLIIGGLIGIAIAAGIVALPFIAANAALILIGASVGVLIGVFALAYDDIKTFFAGGDSLIGRAAERWPRVAKAVKEAFDALRKSLNWFLVGEDPARKGFSLRGALGGDAAPLDFFGKKAIKEADSSPLNSLSTSSILNSKNSNRSVQIGDITINTQATDADGIMTSLQSRLDKEFWHPNSNFDDGVFA